MPPFREAILDFIKNFHKRGVGGSARFHTFKLKWPISSKIVKPTIFHRSSHLRVVFLMFVHLPHICHMNHMRYRCQNFQASVKIPQITVILPPPPLWWWWWCWYHHYNTTTTTLPPPQTSKSVVSRFSLLCRKLSWVANFGWLWWLFTLFCRIFILSQNLR